MRTKLLWIVYAFISFTIWGCNSPKQNKEKESNDTSIGISESFDEFIKRFEGDKDFQLSRIKFPMGKILLYENDKASEPKEYQFTKDLWSFIIGENQFVEREIDFGSDVYSYKEKSENKVVWRHNMYHSLDGYDQITFELINGKWYVTSREVVFPYFITIDTYKENTSI